MGCVDEQDDVPDLPYWWLVLRALLRTRNLAYKALTFPESLTPAERNRILRMPPPDEVTANTKQVTNGAMSTPNELV